jgi:hypothetical protein
MKPTPEQVEAARAWTRCTPSSPITHEQAATLQAYVEANKGVHGLWEWSDAPAFILLAALEAAEADSARLDWLQHQLANMDSKARGTWLRIGDKGRVQVHRYPLHAMSVWDDSECVMDSIPDGTNDLREAIDAAIKSEKE